MGEADDVATALKSKITSIQNGREERDMEFHPMLLFEGQQK